VSLVDLHRRLAALGPDELIGELRELRVNVDHLRYLFSSDPALVDGAVDTRLNAVEANLAKVEALVVNMQSSHVSLPDPRQSTYSVWVVPVRTAPEYSLLAYRQNAIAHARMHRLEFYRDGSGPTWQWKLRAQELDTGIPTRPEP